MKTKSLVILLCYLIATATVAQPLKNFDSKGKAQKSTTDFLTASVGTENKAALAPALIPLIVGAGINVFNTIKEKRKPSYTAIYSNTFSLDSNTLLPDGLPRNIVLQRAMLNDKREGTYQYEELKPIASTFTLVVVPDTARITIQLASCLLNRSKARYRPGHTLAITINIKLVGTDKEGAAIDLGEANIIVPMIYVRDAEFNLKEVEKYLTKANFLPLPEAAAKRPVSMAIQITEVNLNKVSPSVAESILKSNASDITGLLGGALGVK